MSMRRLSLPALLLVFAVAAAPKKPAGIAPSMLPHPIAIFLSDLSRQGTRQVTFKANALGTRFFFEEPSGVTVYHFASGQYVKEAFLPGAKLPAAMRRFQKR